MTSLSSPGNKLDLALSAVFVLVGGDALANISSLQLPEYHAKGGHWQFLTNLSLLFTVIYFSFNAVYHLLPSCKITKKVKSYLSAITTSLEWIVFLIYWLLRIFATDLILPKGVPYIPLSLDLRIHFLPFTSLAINYFVFSEAWDISYVEGFLCVVALAVSYWNWLEYLLPDGERYPYPFMEGDTSHRFVVFGVVGLVAFASFCFFKAVHPKATDSTSVSKIDEKDE